MKTLLGLILAFATLPMYGQQILAPILFHHTAATGTVATPTFSYDGTSQLTISTTTPLAVICYTTDGSTPTEVSNLCSGGTTATYSTALTSTPTETVKALATLVGYTDSAVASTTIYFGCPTGSGSCVDYFGGTNGTALNTYNLKWMSLSTNCFVYSGSYGLTLNGSGEVILNHEACYGGYYVDSTSTTSHVTWIAQAGTSSSNNKGPCVDATLGTIVNPSGYCLKLVGTISGGNYPDMEVIKNGNNLSEWVGTFSATTNHDMIISVNNSTHVITATVDATTHTYTDSSSPLTSGYPGFYEVNSTTTYTDSLIGTWCDYATACN